MSKIGAKTKDRLKDETVAKRRIGRSYVLVTAMLSVVVEEVTRNCGFRKIRMQILFKFSADAVEWLQQGRNKKKVQNQ